MTERRGSEDSLNGQADTLVAAAAAAASWFESPAIKALSAARSARLRAMGWREAAITANAPRMGLAKLDVAGVSFALCEAVEHSVQAVSEAVRYGVDPDDGLRAASDAVRKAAVALAQATAGKGATRVEAIIQAKKWAFEAERLRRVIRAESHEDVSLPRALKREAVSTRLSNAAEAVQAACDAFAGSESE